MVNELCWQKKNEGVDWKALSHAVRVATQAITLFETGEVVFPLYNAKHLLEIKIGQLPYKQIAEEIENLLPQVYAAAEKSTLPEALDQEWIDDFIYEKYSKAVRKTLTSVRSAE